MKKSILYILLSITALGCEPEFEANPAESQEIIQTCQVGSIITNNVDAGTTSSIAVTSDARNNPSRIDIGTTGNYLFEYNERGHLTKVSIYTPDAQTGLPALAGYVEYYYVKKSCNPDSSATYFRTFSANKVTVMIRYAGAQYEYKDDLLTKAITKVNETTTTQRFEYDTNQNLTKIYVQNGQATEYLSSEFIGFDGKYSYQRSNRAWMIFYNRYGKGNPVREKNYNAAGSVTADYTYEYVYNTNNFPTKIDKYQGVSQKRFNETIMNLGYSCVK
jgi:YD repeat-containing protein